MAMDCNDPEPVGHPTLEHVEQSVVLLCDLEGYVLQCPWEVKCGWVRWRLCYM